MIQIVKMKFIIIFLFLLGGFDLAAQTWTWKGQSDETITIKKTLTTENYCELVVSVNIGREVKQHFFMASWDNKTNRWLTINEQRCEGWIDLQKKRIGWNTGSKILTFEYSEL